VAGLLCDLWQHAKGLARFILSFTTAQTNAMPIFGDCENIFAMCILPVCANKYLSPEYQLYEVAESRKLYNTVGFAIPHIGIEEYNKQTVSFFISPVVYCCL
jgi:mannitol/fructose-specific phosphotransferase system IIA component (Ntr-type)